MKGFVQNKMFNTKFWQLVKKNMSAGESNIKQAESLYQNPLSFDIVWYLSTKYYYMRKYYIQRQNMFIYVAHAWLEMHNINR